MVAELIAEGTSTPVVVAGGSVLAAGRGVVRHASSDRPVEPLSQGAAADSDIGSDAPGALAALTTPLSVGNVTETQGLATRDPNSRETVETEDPIRPDRALNAPLDAGDVSDSRAIARKGTDPRSTGKEEATEEPVEKAKAEGQKLVENDKEKGPDGLTEEERRQVEELKRRDAEVKAHEQAHSAAGGPYAGAPRFRFVRGPDGKFYAVAGEVTIDTSAIPNNPEATIRKMEQVKRAALAPQQPSAQDRRVAAEAERKILQARQQIREEETEKVRKAQEKVEQQAAEAQGQVKTLEREEAPIFDPEARFRSRVGGTGPAPGTGLVGPGEMDVDASDVIDAKALFSMVA